MNNKKLLMALSIIGLLSTNNSYAASCYAGGYAGGYAGATAAVNAGFATYFSPMGIYTQSAAKQTQQVVNASEAIQATQKVQIDQQEMNLEKQDYRSRIATGMAEIAKKDSEQRPTIQQCVEASKSAYRAGSGSASFGGGKTRGTKNGGGEDAGSEVDRIINSSAALAEPLKDMSKNLTCSTQFGGAAGCPDSNQEYAGGDIQAQSLTVNISSVDRGANKDENFANWTLNNKAQAVAQGYINNTVYSKAPKSFGKGKEGEFKNNPIYTAMYRQVISKLDASADALKDIVSFRAASTLTSFAKEKWNQNSTDYALMYPKLKFPKDTPSLYEVINFEVANDFMGKKSEKPLTDELELQQDIAKKLALSNYIAWKQYSATEKSNILLSNILVQAVTPVDIKAVDSEFNRVNKVSATAK